jgi:hypothetical protein
MRRLVVIALVLLVARPAAAHVGSPDVFFEGDAGPYPVFVTIRTPDVIPGVATIEIRTTADDVHEVSVVPMRLTGPGSELPPAPDRAERSPDDPKFFTASLWLMEHGSLQVRIAVTGARGPGKVAVPVPAVAQRTLTMDRPLGALLLGLMAVLALAVISILAGAVREAALDPGVLPDRRARRRSRIAVAVVGTGVVGLLAFGNAWWNAEARGYEDMIMRPWTLEPTQTGCTLALPPVTAALLPDHGHEVHLFLVRTPALDVIAHLHPQRLGEAFTQPLPSLPAGHYALYADVVFGNGFPLTGTAELDLPALTCDAPTGDDVMWTGGAGHLVWDRPPGAIRAGMPLALRFHVDSGGNLEPYMGMAGHAIVTKRDRTVFAHLHPSGSVAMPALDLAMPMDMAMPMHHPTTLPPEVAFPYGFPTAGDYRVFVQVKRSGQIETSAFDIQVD